MPEFPHSVLILATFLLFFRRKQNNHSPLVSLYLTFGKQKLWNFPASSRWNHWVNRHWQEIGFFVGGELPALGRPITINEAADHIFGSSEKKKNGWKKSGPGQRRLDSTDQ